MKVKQGKLLTRRRAFLVNAYTQRRYTRRPMTGVTGHWNHPDYIAWKAWVEDFERFMLHGYDRTLGGGGTLENAPTDHAVPTVADARGPDRPTIQVD